MGLKRIRHESCILILENQFMRILGTLFMSLFLAQGAFAYSTGAQSLFGLQNAGPAGAANTGEGVGTGYLSCGCAEQVITKNIQKGGLCENYSRLHVGAFTRPGAIAPTVAPANALLTHQ